MANVAEDPCAIARSLSVLGERWTFLILREAYSGATRFSEFRKALGVAPDVLTDRLNTLVQNGVMEKAGYREPGARTRDSYVLTPAGLELGVALAALQQWGDDHLPWPEGPSILRRIRGTDRPVHIGFIGDDGREVDPDEVEQVRTAAYPVRA